MHESAASDRQSTSAFGLRVLLTAAVVAVAVAIIRVVIIRPSARGVLG